LKVLITGIAGFVGKHLLAYLTREECADENLEILGVDLSLENIDAGDYKKPGFKIMLEEADLTDGSRVSDIIKKFKPERIYHLAARSSVSYSWGNPLETFRANVFGGINILEALRIFSPQCRTLMVCTAEEYGGAGGNDKPIDENSRISPRNPYAISKSALDFFSSVYWDAYKIPVLISRSFNHIGPGQSEGFVVSDFAKQVALIDKGMQKPVIMVGNIKSCRDFLDVRDVVKAYSYIIDRGRTGEAYNVCSGKKTRISDLLDILISLSETGNIKVEIDRSKFRAIDVEAIYGDNSKLKSHTGWSPEYSIRTSLEDALRYWKNKIS